MSDVEENEDDFKSPRVNITRVYTRGGDSGQTSLVGGERVVKDDARLEAYGTVDELNAVVGVVCALARDVSAAEALTSMRKSLLRVQHELFNLGSILATPADKVGAKQPRVTQVDIERLEREMDSCNETLPPLRSFVLPGGSPISAQLHVARTVCRRAERRCVTLARLVELDALCVRYLNRLSDALFVWSRSVDQALGRDEVLWQPNHGGA